MPQNFSGRKKIKKISPPKYNLSFGMVRYIENI